MSSSMPPFHEGELALQQRAGQRGVAERNAAMIRDDVVPGGRAFVGEQRTLAVGVVDHDGRPWASLLIGERGFVRCREDGRALILSRSLMRRLGPDLALDRLRSGDEVGVLAIELGTRRRLRMNGKVALLEPEQLVVSIEQSFVNCPKYIQRRELLLSGADRRAWSGPVRGIYLDGDRSRLVSGIDTAFVASRHPSRGLDVSHRGGAPGFVRVVDERTLRFPDYPGNGMFQTLGNFEVEPRAGVVLVDFADGRVLSLTGSTSTRHGYEDPQHPTGGTARYWDLHIDEWWELPLAAVGGWSSPESSPVNPPPFCGL